MKKRNRKGFTIVELVIVIAVIAVLAAVLIPSFSNIIDKANESVDVQAASLMNVALAAGSIPDVPEEPEDMIKILADAGFNSETCLIPVTKGYRFYWTGPEYNTIVLAQVPAELLDNEPQVQTFSLAEETAESLGIKVICPTENEKLVAAVEEALVALYDHIVNETPLPDDFALFDLAQGIAFLDGSGGAGDYGGFNGSVATDVDLAAALSQGGNITLTGNIELDSDTTIPTDGWDLGVHSYYVGLFNIPADTDTTLDLGGNTLTINIAAFTQTVDGESEEADVAILNGGNFTLKNGTLIIEGEGTEGACALYNTGNGTMTIENAIITSVVADDQDYATDLIKNYGKFSMSGTTVNAKRGCFAEYSEEIVTLTNCVLNTEKGDYSRSDEEVYAIYYSGDKTMMLDDVTINVSNTTHFGTGANVVGVYVVSPTYCDGTVTGNATVNGEAKTYTAS